MPHECDFAVVDAGNVPEVGSTWDGSMLLDGFLDAMTDRLDTA